MSRPSKALLWASLAFALYALLADAGVQFALITAVLCAGGPFFVEHWLKERRKRDAAARIRMAVYREQWFASFERRRRMQAGRR